MKEKPAQEPFRKSTINWTIVVIWLVITLCIFCYQLGIDHNPEKHSRQWGGPLITNVWISSGFETQFANDLATGGVMILKLLARFGVAGLVAGAGMSLIYFFIYQAMKERPSPQQLKQPYPRIQPPAMDSLKTD